MAWLVLLVVAGDAAALPDPDAAPRYADSECLEAFDRRFVIDLASVLTDDDLAFAEDAACHAYQAVGAHLVLVTVATTEGEPIDSYAPRLLNGWGVGDPERHDGLVLLHAVSTGPAGEGDTGAQAGALRVETGYGLEGVVNALLAKEAVDTAARIERERIENGSAPHEARSHALAATFAGLALFVAQNHDGEQPEAASPFPWRTAILVAIAILLIVALALRPRSGRGTRMGPGPGGWGGSRGWGGAGGMGGWGGRGGGWGGGRGGWGGRRGGGGFGGGRSGGGGWGGRF